MAGTKAGGLKTAQTNKLKYGEDFYKRLGAIGGTKSHNGGFYGNPELAREAGRKGGKKSKRGSVKLPVESDVALTEHKWYSWLKQTFSK